MNQQGRRAESCEGRKDLLLVPSFGRHTPTLPALFHGGKQFAFMIESNVHDPPHRQQAKRPNEIGTSRKKAPHHFHGAHFSLRRPWALFYH